jgi:hypothetical protein
MAPENVSNPAVINHHLLHHAALTGTSIDEREEV